MRGTRGGPPIPDFQTAENLPRRDQRPGYGRNIRPENKGAGNAGRPMRPIAACAMGVVERTRVVRSHRNHPAFPTQWFYGLYVISPGTGLSCPRHWRNRFRRLDASVGASGPHDFAVRIKRHSSKAPKRPPHPAPTSVTIAIRPLCGTGCAQDACDLGGARREIFFAKGPDCWNQIESLKEIGFLAHTV